MMTFSMRMLMDEVRRVSERTGQWHGLYYSMA